METIKATAAKLLLLSRKAVLMRKNGYIITIIQFLVAIIFTLRIRLIFEPQALHLQHNELEKISTILKQMPKDVKCRYVPNDQFVDNLMSNAGRLLNIKIKPAAPKEMDYKDSSAKSLWVIFTLSEDKSNKPKILEYKIRSYDYTNGLSAVWDDEEPSEEDPYMRTGFIPLQLAIDISFLDLWKLDQSFDLKNKVWIGRFPHHTLNLLVMPVLLEPSTIIAYCLMIMALILIPAELLHKVVHDKGRGFRQLMHVMGMSLMMLYTGWILYMLIVAVPVTVICTIILNPVLENAYPSTIFMFVLLYLIMSSCFMFFVGSFFNDSLTASLIGTMLWLLLSYLSTILDNYTNKMSYLSKISTLCLPHNGLLYGLFNFATRENMVQSVSHNLHSRDNSTHLRFDADSDSMTLAKSIDLEEASNLVHNKHQISSSMILLSWLLHSALWMLLTFYFDNLRPGRHGAAKHWYYPCQRFISAPLIDDINYHGTTKWSTVEKTRPGLTPIITIRQLTKKFGTRKNQLIAIDGMTMDFYEGEFHIILGHNGAGKSTLLKMIVGMYEPSKGRIYILGKDYNRQQGSRENLIGYCPQDNILVNDLTAIEHVYLFGMLKGMSYNDAFKKAELILIQLGLKANQNQKIKHFSLGMKRRVSLSMALIGTAKILVLDEPGYGVDPQNRRKIWDTLLAFREERTIIMTTNSMEAADILPDRIAIIANGKVECYGTKMYLNRRFGVAYLLSIVIEEDCDLNHLTIVIQNFSSDPIKLRTRLGLVIKYDLPRRTAFTKLLHYLEKNSRSLRIKSIGLNATSIEEQFRRIGFMSSIKSRRGMNYHYNDHEFEMMIRKRRHDLLSKGKNWTRKKGNSLSTQQIGIMIYKKFLHILAIWNIYGYSLLFSLISLIVCMEMAMRMNLHIATTRTNVMNISRYTVSNLGILLHDNTDSKTLLDSFINTIKYYDANKTTNYYVSNILTTTKLVSNPTWNSMKLREHYFMGIDVSKNDVVSLLYSVTASHSGPISINFLHNALLKHNGCSDCEIRITTEPILDPTQWQSRIVDTAGVRNWQNFALAVTLFLLLPSINLVTKELRSSSKQLQLNTTGMSLLKYWTPIYTADILIYILCVALIISLIPISFREASHVSIMEFVLMLAIFLLYGIAALPMGYILHFFIKRAEIACIIVIMLNAMTLISLNGNLTHPILMRILTTDGQQIVGVIFHMFPQYVLACAIGTFLSIHTYNKQCEHLDGCSTPFWAEDPCCQACGDRGCYKQLSILWTERVTNIFHHSIMVDIVILLVDTLLFLTIIMLFESRYKARIKKCFEQKIYPSGITESITEPHVLFEKERVDKFMTERKSGEIVSPDIMLSVQKLTKKYGRKAVLRGINFNVYKNECLGLLGINGAGKSTIYKILSREDLPTTGRVIVQNYDLMKDENSVSGKIGYCPQIGGLNKFMTARQNLRLHATLRGVPLDRVKDEVDKWLDVFDLLDFENIKVKYCPWGIQRKISILQSLIGDLPIVLLDEPTSGLDAIARQVVCDTLHFVREMGRSLLVTTQSMEESESLCLRIGVLVNGQFVAFGSSEQLKHQHGEYFTLNIVMHGATSLDKMEEIKKSVENTFTGFKSQSLHVGVLKYEIEAGATMYSRIFEKLERLKAKHPEISDSSVSQTTMEQVFLSLCEKYQDVENSEDELKCIEKFRNRIHRI